MESLFGTVRGFKALTAAHGEDSIGKGTDDEKHLLAPHMARAMEQEHQNETAGCGFAYYIQVSR